MIVQIDHVGILVTDLEAALRFYTETLGLQAGPIETRDQPPIRRCCVRIGDAELELIEARDPEQTMMRFLPHRGPGIYHLGLRVDDVDAEAAAAREPGFRSSTACAKARTCASSTCTPTRRRAR